MAFAKYSSSLPVSFSQSVQLAFSNTVSPQRIGDDVFLVQA